MRAFTRVQTIWGIGISDAQAEVVREMAGRPYSLKVWPAGELPDFSDPGNLAAPCLICFSFASCKEFLALPLKQTGFLELTPKVLLLDEAAGLPVIEEALDFGVTDIIRHPLTRQRFAPCLRRAAEAAALQRDIQNMAHEIFIEREMLERKNETLSFLANFLSRTSESLDETELLSRAFACMQGLFPVISMHAAIFSRDDNGEVTADLFVGAPVDSPAYAEWRERLLELSMPLSGNGGVHPSSVYLPLAGNAIPTARPGDGHILTLPVHIGENTRMFLLLLTSMEHNLSRDQALALDSALRHMAISIKNVRRYLQVCQFADRDSLTGAYNRRYFEHTVIAEIARHERYGEDLSLLLLDIDHFKNINDTFGHLKGDEVLRAIVKIAMTTIRQTDYCVRYGGEEFVFLLPHTSSRNAAWLAERLRRKIQKLSFTAGKKEFSVTASLGVTSLTPGNSKDGSVLTNEADLALYEAKNTGRNKVVVYASQNAATISL